MSQNWRFSSRQQCSFSLVVFITNIWANPQNAVIYLIAKFWLHLQTLEKCTTVAPRIYYIVEEYNAGTGATSGKRFVLVFGLENVGLLKSITKKLWYFMKICRVSVSPMFQNQLIKHCLIKSIGWFHNNNSSTVMGNKQTAWTVCSSWPEIKSSKVPFSAAVVPAHSRIHVLQEVASLKTCQSLGATCRLCYSFRTWLVFFSNWIQIPFSGRRMSSPTGRSSSLVWQDWMVKLRRTEARTTFSSIRAKRWPVDHRMHGLSVLSTNCRGWQCWTLEFTDAVAESCWEWDVGVGRPSHRVLRKETIRPELLWIREVTGVTVKGVGHHRGVGTFSYLETIWNERWFHCNESKIIS